MTNWRDNATKAGVGFFFSAGVVHAHGRSAKLTFNPANPRPKRFSAWAKRRGKLVAA
jgi:hypothetical protein